MMTKRMLAENLYKLIETTEDDILNSACHSGRDFELAPAIYRLLQDDKDSPIYSYVCCIMANTLDSLHEDPKFIKTVLQDVKKSSNIILRSLEDMKLELDNRKDQFAEQSIGQEVKEAKEQKQATADKQEVAAKAAPEPPKEEQEEVVHRGFHR